MNRQHNNLFCDYSSLDTHVANHLSLFYNKLFINLQILKERINRENIGTQREREKKKEGETETQEQNRETGREERKREKENE